MRSEVIQAAIVFVVTFALVCLGLWLTGCASIGVLPNPPAPAVGTACAGTLRYANDLETAYRARAAINRDSIYLSGLVAIGCGAGIAGMASTGNDHPGTISVTAIVCTAIAAGIALVDNQGLARAYGAAANRIAIATTKDCVTLGSEIAGAQNELELARTGAAASAAVHAEPAN